MAAKTKFRGSLTALVTPFKNGSLDEAAFRGLVSWQIEQPARARTRRAKPSTLLFTPRRPVPMPCSW